MPLKNMKTSKPPGFSYDPVSGAMTSVSDWVLRVSLVIMGCFGVGRVTKDLEPIANGQQFSI